MLVGCLDGFLNRCSAVALVFFGNMSFSLVDDCTVVPKVSNFFACYLVSASCIVPMVFAVKIPFFTKGVTGCRDFFFFGFATSSASINFDAYLFAVRRYFYPSFIPNMNAHILG